MSDDENESLAHFLESEVLSEMSDQEEPDPDEPEAKRPCFEEEGDRRNDDNDDGDNQVGSSSSSSSRSAAPLRVESGNIGRIPPELFPHILNYCMRWGLLPLTNTPRQCPWKKLYVQRDGEDMVGLLKNCQPEFKGYYMQMQAAKRSQAPLPSQVKDDRILFDKTVADQVSIWKRNNGFTDKVILDHACSGETCSYYRIGDAFVCEETGNVHVCDDTCREVDMDPTNELLVCKISGHCFDRMLSPSEMEPDADQQGGAATDEAEPFMGSGRFARAYLLGYNCADEKELEDALRFC
ncbi:hypothetical protein CDL15_Pgr018153 [Punica granatum]|uniref:F-box protein SKIP31-like n=1 Tax=Punica granatum TaxID=22663 RepID=A0A218WID4_PUNGR|nr:hypothetical protein CDL15_Pgr018153 [Punica granatum]